MLDCYNFNDPKFVKLFCNWEFMSAIWGHWLWYKDKESCRVGECRGWTGTYYRAECVLFTYPCFNWTWLVLSLICPLMCPKWQELCIKAWKCRHWFTILIWGSDLTFFPFKIPTFIILCIILQEGKVSISTLKLFTAGKPYVQDPLLHYKISLIYIKCN